MRTIVAADDPGALDREVTRLKEILANLGRRRPLRDPFATSCECDDLTPPQLHSLAWLGRDGPLTMGELARRVGITDKTMTGVVDRLEQAGHLQRERDEGDRRVVHVRLTRRGQAAYARIEANLDAHLRAVLSLVDAEERAAFFRIVEKMVEKLLAGADAGGAGARE